MITLGKHCHIPQEFCIDYPLNQLRVCYRPDYQLCITVLSVSLGLHQFTFRYVTDRGSR